MGRVDNHAAVLFRSECEKQQTLKLTSCLEILTGRFEGKLIAAHPFKNHGEIVILVCQAADEFVLPVLKLTAESSR